MGSAPLVDEGLGSDGGAGVPDVAELGLVEAYECHDEHVALEPEDDADRDVWFVRMGDAPETMSSGLADTLEGGGFLGRFALELAECLEQRERDLLSNATGFFDGGEPAIEVLGPVQDHRATIIQSDYNLQVVLTFGDALQPNESGRETRLRRALTSADVETPYTSHASARAASLRRSRPCGGGGGARSRPLRAHLADRVHVLARRNGP